MVSRIERNIVKEILRDCRPKNIQPNENFVMYVVKLFLLDPNWGITENLLTSRANVQTFVKYMINQLGSKDSVDMMTLKMQFYYMWSTEHIQDVLTNNTSSLLAKLSPIKDQICLIRRISTEEDMDNLRRLIVVYIVFLSGLGNAMRDEVFLEGLTAMKSVMTEEELREFCTIGKDQKETQLKELSKIVCGIRLFNKYCDKGGVGIPDLAEIFKSAVKIVRDEMDLILLKVLAKVEYLTKLFEKYYAMRKYGPLYFMESVFPSHVEKGYIEFCKDQLIHYRQYEVIIRKNIESAEALINKVTEIEENINTLMEHIFTIVSTRLAVPVKIIFPLFNRLSDLWTDLQHQMILLTRHSNIMSNLDTYSKMLSFNHALIEDLLREEYVLENIYIVETVDCCLIKYKDLIDIVDLDDYENVHLEYLGFCCYKLVESNGALIPGITDIGVAVYNGKFYAFSSAEAYHCFKLKPQEYINRVLYLARKKPQLIHFLMLDKELLSVSNVKKLVGEKLYVKKSTSVKVQTENRYVVPPSKDVSYKWNVWDLKREVILMSNLLNCKTVSTQTVKSHSTNALSSQTVLQKCEETQTTIDKYTSVPTPSNFIFGLRGRKDDKQFVLELTRPVAE
ncbi:cilia- and flagella-associated protein 206-like isoform X2 [Diorhabda carinulata]|uniref:cilia- and flagella-associated protein 206-like isoform X2 n=1 Tax=Diorhabda carinulata TaxID=1163345 RepID=UPI0025A2CEFD|nr:cilia- and flagella-associated protein 206-like isoform X2 [Diorhabda carinulata]